MVNCVFWCCLKLFLMISCRGVLVCRPELRPVTPWCAFPLAEIWYRALLARLCCCTLLCVYILRSMCSAALGHDVDRDLSLSAKALHRCTVFTDRTPPQVGRQSSLQNHHDSPCAEDAHTVVFTHHVCMCVKYFALRNVFGQLYVATRQPLLSMGAYRSNMCFVKLFDLRPRPPLATLAASQALRDDPPPHPTGPMAAGLLTAIAKTNAAICRHAEVSMVMRGGGCGVGWGDSRSDSAVDNADAEVIFFFLAPFFLLVCTL